MKFNYSTISILILNMAINFVAVFCLAVSADDFAAGEEQTERKVSFNDTWLFLNSISREDYSLQQERIFRITREGSFLEDEKRIAEAAEILQLPAKKLSDNFLFTDKVKIMPNDILEGYTIEDDVPLSLQDQGKPSFRMTLARFNKEKWTCIIDTSSGFKGIANKSGGNGYIRIAMAICGIDENPSNKLVYVVTSGNMPTEKYLKLYKIQKGPGDACLVSVINDAEHNNSIRLSDRRVAFIRGNVVVYLTSYYQNIGCWDLACKLDALLVRQMSEKQQKEK